VISDVLIAAMIVHQRTTIPNIFIINDPTTHTTKHSSKPSTNTCARRRNNRGNQVRNDGYKPKMTNPKQAKKSSNTSVEKLQHVLKNMEQ